MTDTELLRFITTEDKEETGELFSRARAVREQHYGKAVYFRGLIEFTNYCKNDCYYCGIRCGNMKVRRYRLSLEQILRCCAAGDMMGFKTFVLQGGEDPYYTEEHIREIVQAIRRKFPYHAITLSIGEWKRESYEAFFRAGANRYLMRHETADGEHYARLHPTWQTLEARKQCLFDLRDIGYQVGSGFMVGSPFQKPQDLLEDLHFLQQLNPQMVGIGPFIPHADTPFAAYPAGTVELTLKMLALTRLLLPKTLLPATTALGTIDPKGREKALMAGANVVMPNLSPVGVRGLYTLYNNKICTGEEAAECLLCMQGRIHSCGFVPDMGRGDSLVALKTP
ncbi:MAG: [FeFe] hydrogenase H-cluster radical SAM maturase HydE [Spirochaetales bacterium]|jgi:biotin synthase|nr:[FeFe] hydrogenase H-cluster radical SAM maturase HydE [Spirochaetales bacterium]